MREIACSPIYPILPLSASCSPHVIPVHGVHSPSSLVAPGSAGLEGSADCATSSLYGLDMHSVKHGCYSTRRQLCLGGVTAWQTLAQHWTNLPTVASTPANTRRWTNAGLMLGQRRRRWTNITQHCFNVSCLLGHVVHKAQESHWLLKSGLVQHIFQRPRTAYKSINKTVWSFVFMTLAMHHSLEPTVCFIRTWE